MTLISIDSILSLLPYYQLTLTLLLALLLDYMLGEARRYHYLVGFGSLAHWVEQRLNTQLTLTPALNVKALGCLAWFILVMPLPIIYWHFFNDFTWYWQVLLDGIILYLAVGLNSLQQHAMQVYSPLKLGDINTARYFTGYLVSRDTRELTPENIARATVESMLENGHDSVIASLVYYLLGGAPLVIVHRFANTLDAMWGYKSRRFIHFGYTSARLDDLLGFLSGKICTLLYALQGQFLSALINAYQQGRCYKSHNGGWVMAAGATVMKRKLGGSSQYHGSMINSVQLGEGKSVSIDDIPASVNVVKRATIILLVVVGSYQTLMIS